MIKYASDVTIARPPAVVYPYLVEREKQALWSDVQMRPITEGDMRPGSRLEVSFGRGPLHARIVLEMTAVEVERRMAFTTAEPGPIFWEGEYRVEPAGQGTKLSQAGLLRFNGFWRLLEPIVGAEIRSGEIKELETLKSVIEAAA